ncbi:MAG: alkaline phosphatase family protein [bacterium]|nr:alkaline phosphatase family protein [bacterium]
MTNIRHSTAERRTLIFGIDGGTWEVLEPLTRRGVMPHLAGLMQKGVWGKLTSTIPVNSAAAWSSIISGAPPEKHSVYDFFRWRQDGAGRSTANASFLPRPTLLDQLGESGQALSLRVPMTYPPWPVKGYMVSGLPTPDDESAFTYPADLAPYLNTMIEKGSAGRSWQLDDDQRGIILDQLEAAQRSLERMTEYLLSLRTLATCFVVVRDVDELQHFFWDTLSGHDHLEYLPRLEAYFSVIDQYLGRMLDWTGMGGRVVIMSDHGFGPVEGIWHLNDWLHSNGFLKYREPSNLNTSKGELTFRRRLSFAIGRRVLREFKSLGIGGKSLENWLTQIKLSAESGVDLNGIDWSATRAYTGNVGEEYLPIYINLAGREPHGSVAYEDYYQVRDELRRCLLDTHQPEVKAAHFAEDIFDVVDPRAQTTPDIVVETVTGAVQSDFSMHNLEVFEKSRYRNGCHRREGIFLLSGAEIEPGRGRANILDIPATILAWMGIPLPEHFSGRVLSEFIPGISSIQRNAETTCVETGQFNLSEDEEAGVRKKLESLGYL